MDIANFVLTFGPAGLIVYSIGKRLVMAGRKDHTARVEGVARRPRPALPRVMYRSQRSLAVSTVAVAPAATIRTAATAPIVTPNNEYSSGLSDSGRTAFETTAKTIAALYEAGLITNLSKSICRAYGCSVQAAAKTDSTYQMALKAVNRYLPKQESGPQFRTTPEMEGARAVLGLNRNRKVRSN